MFNKIVNHDREIKLLKKYIESLREQLKDSTDPHEKEMLLFNIEEEEVELSVLENNLQGVLEDD